MPALILVGPASRKALDLAEWTAMPNDTPVWRYLSLRAVIDTIERLQLRLTRVDTFRDAFEGSVTKKQMEDQNLILAGGEARRHMLNSVAAHHGGMAPAHLLGLDAQGCNRSDRHKPVR